MSGAKIIDDDICPTCGSANGCGIVRGDATCWCFTLPHVLPLNENGGRCYCRKYLTRLIAERTTGDATLPSEGCP
jgi:cysteine-rich CWC protein